MHMSVDPALNRDFAQMCFADMAIDLVWLLEANALTARPALQETWKGLEEAVDQGLVRSIGVSNHSPEKIQEWFADARIKPAVNQASTTWHLLARLLAPAIHCDHPSQKESSSTQPHL